MVSHILDRAAWKQIAHLILELINMDGHSKIRMNKQIEIFSVQKMYGTSEHFYFMYLDHGIKFQI